MKLRAQREGLAIKVAIATANLAKDQLMAISGDNAADKAGANALLLGRLVVPAKTAGGIGTVELSGRFKEKIEVKVNMSGGLAAGDYAKLAAVDGTTGESRVAKWATGTDVWERCIGVVIKGAADAGVAEVLTF
ncbi:hypothetical protein BH10ACI2_BH10ACI2_21100 [soil metagenome]